MGRSLESSGGLLTVSQNTPAAIEPRRFASSSSKISRDSRRRDDHARSIDRRVRVAQREASSSNEQLEETMSKESNIRTADLVERALTSYK